MFSLSELKNAVAEHAAKSDIPSSPSSTSTKSKVAYSPPPAPISAKPKTAQQAPPPLSSVMENLREGLPKTPLEVSNKNQQPERKELNRQKKVPNELRPPSFPPQASFLRGGKLEQNNENKILNNFHRKSIMKRPAQPLNNWGEPSINEVDIQKANTFIKNISKSSTKQNSVNDHGFASKQTAYNIAKEFDLLPESSKFIAMRNLRNGNALPHLNKEASNKIIEQIISHDEKLALFMNTKIDFGQKKVPYKYFLNNENVPKDKICVIDRVCKSDMNKVLGFRECLAVSLYAGGFVARPINQALRERNGCPETALADVVRKAALTLSQSEEAQQQNLRYDLMSGCDALYRYIKTPQEKDGQKLTPKAFIEKYIGKKGDMITDPSIISTSMSFSPRTQSVICNVIKGNPDICILYSDVQSAIPLVDNMASEEKVDRGDPVSTGGLGHCAQYAEAIISPGTNFQVVDIDYNKKNDMATVILKEISEEDKLASQQKKLSFFERVSQRIFPGHLFQ